MLDRDQARARAEPARRGGFAGLLWRLRDDPQRRLGMALFGPVGAPARVPPHQPAQQPQPVGPRHELTDLFNGSTEARPDTQVRQPGPSREPTKPVFAHASPTCGDKRSSMSPDSWQRTGLASEDATSARTCSTASRRSSRGSRPSRRAAVVRAAFDGIRRSASRAASAAKDVSETPVACGSIVLTRMRSPSPSSSRLHASPFRRTSRGRGSLGVRHAGPKP